MDGIHDMGGMDGFGAVVTDDGELTHHEPWELRAQALALQSLGGARRWIEQLDPAIYLASSYYVRWLRAAELGCVVKGQLTDADLDRWQRAFSDDESAVPPRSVDPAKRAFVEHYITHGLRLDRAAKPAFAVGDRVAVRRMHEVRHNRCPRYVRGAPGRIEKICFDDRVPSGTDPSDVEAVYTVEFSSADLWGATTEASFTVLVDLCESYLEGISGGVG